MTIPPILAEADRLVREGKHFTDAAFLNHGASCSVRSRDDFLKRVTPNFAEKYAALEAMKVPDNLKADKDEYLKLLLDEAYTTKAFHDFYDKSQWKYAYQSAHMKKNAKDLSVWSPEAAYPIYISDASKQRKIIGAKLDTALNVQKFAALMPEFKMPNLASTQFKSAIFNV